MRRARPIVPLLLAVTGVCAPTGPARADALRLTFVPDPPAAGGSDPAPGSQPVVPAAHPAVPALGFDPDWTIRVEPMLWYVGPSGKLKMPVNSGTGPGAFTTEGNRIKVNDLDMASTRMSPAGAFTLAHARWQFTFSGADYSLTRADSTVSASGRLGAVPITPGDHLATHLSFGTYEATAGYRFWAYDFAANSEHPEHAAPAKFAVYGIAGAQFFDVNVDITNLSASGARTSASHLFAEPIVGVRAEATIAENFNLVLQLSGGFLPGSTSSSTSFDLFTTFEWRVSRTVGVMIGWRQVAFDVSDGKDLSKFEYQGRMAGLFASVVIRF